MPALEDTKTINVPSKVTRRWLAESLKQSGRKTRIVIPPDIDIDLLAEGPAAFWPSLIGQRGNALSLEVNGDTAEAVFEQPGYSRLFKSQFGLNLLEAAHDKERPERLESKLRLYVSTQVQSQFDHLYGSSFAHFLCKLPIRRLPRCFGSLSGTFPSFSVFQKQIGEALSRVTSGQLTIFSSSAPEFVFHALENAWEETDHITDRRTGYYGISVRSIHLHKNRRALVHCFSDPEFLHWFQSVNVPDHSYIVSITVTDFGRGITGSLRRLYELLETSPSEVERMNVAFQKDVSSKQGLSQNTGQGLPSINALAFNQRGFLVVDSGPASVFRDFTDPILETPSFQDLSISMGLHQYTSITVAWCQ